MLVNRVGQAPAVGARGGARGAGGFRLPAARGAAAEAAPAEAAPGAAALGGMLMLQEQPDPAVADRAARRHGQDMLAALAALQLALLGGGGGDPAALAELLRSVPVAADPALRAMVAAIALRGRIEAARRGVGCAETS